MRINSVISRGSRLALNYQITQIPNLFSIRAYSRIRGYFLVSAHQRKSAAKVSSPFPHKRIKAAAGFKAQAAVKFHGLGIGFSHGKAQTQEVTGAQLLGA
jgi:hypothetical protein